MWVLSIFGLAALLLGLFFIFPPVIAHIQITKKTKLYNKEAEEFNKQLIADGMPKEQMYHHRKDAKRMPEFRDSNIVWLGMVLTTVVLFFPTISLDNHLSNLITLKVNNQLVSIYQTQIDDLNTEFKTIDMKADALMNGDTPVATMIQAKVDLTKKLTEVKVYEYQANKEILERSKGGFWWIPKLIPE